MRCKYGGIEVARRNNGEEGRRRKKERGTVLNIENFQGEEFFFEKFFFRQSLKISSYLEELANFFLFLSFLIIILLSLSKTWFVQRERERRNRYRASFILCDEHQVSLSTTFVPKLLRRNEKTEEEEEEEKELMQIVQNLCRSWKFNLKSNNQPLKTWGR